MPRPLFGFPNGTSEYYAVDDEARFLMAYPAGRVDPTAGPAEQYINIIVNWFEELKQRVPGGR